MIAITVAFEIDPDHVEAFRAGVLKHAKNSLTNEEGCRRFDVNEDPESANRFFLYEMYDDQQAFAVHQAADYFAKFGATIENWVLKKDLDVWNLMPPA